MSDDDKCEHRYLTSHGRGWECADCGVGILCLSVPIPLPTIAEALVALSISPSEGAKRGME